jgi:hypothetical protein
MKSNHSVHAVACCGECGTPVVISCPNGHDPEPIEIKAPGPKPETVERMQRGLDKYAAGITNGGVAVILESPACQLSTPRVKRAYRLRDRVCACGATFSPAKRSQTVCTPTCAGVPT